MLKSIHQYRSIHQHTDPNVLTHKAEEFLHLAELSMSFAREYKRRGLPAYAGDVEVARAATRAYRAVMYWLNVAGGCDAMHARDCTQCQKRLKPSYRIHDNAAWITRYRGVMRRSHHYSH